MTTVKQWDEWFAATADEESLRAWRVAKGLFADPARLDAWATIIELNRLDRIIAEEERREQAKQGAPAEGG